MEIVFAIITFIGLFFAWVVLPTILKKRHAVKVEQDRA